MGPLELIYSWQALLVAMCASGTTQFFKTIVDVLRGVKEDDDGTLSTWEYLGRQARKDTIVLNRIVFPTMVVLLGAAWAMVIPARPEVLHTYIAEYKLNWHETYVVYGAWGAFCGQFADYLFTKAKEVISDLIARRSSNAG